MNASSTSDSSNFDPKLWIAFGMAIVGLLAACCIPLGFSLYIGLSKANEMVSLTVLALGGVLGLIAVLGLMACIFAALDIADRGQALGLPEGTIRAVIALGLIMIFGMSSLFLFGRLSEGSVVMVHGLTKAQKDALPAEQIVDVAAEPTPAAPPGSGPQELTYSVKRTNLSRASEDFAKQILTTISTLVVAIASFYFGAKSVESATSAALGQNGSATAAGPPEIGQIDPSSTTLPSADTDLSLSIGGRNLQDVGTVRLVGPESAGKNDVKELLASKVTATSGAITCTLTVPPNAAVGTWQLVLETKQGSKVQRDDAFSVQPA